MERWCETATAVINGTRKKMTPAQAAVHAVQWEKVRRDRPAWLLPEQTSVPAIAAGSCDDLIRMFSTDGYHVR